MVAWRIWGQQNLSDETYRVEPDAYVAKVEAMAAEAQGRRGGDSGVPIVHPPPSSDVYLLARLWQWWPVLELEKGKKLPHPHVLGPTGSTASRCAEADVDVQVHPGLRHGRHHDPERDRRLRHRLQRILRHRPSPDDRQDPRRRQIELGK
jgi:cytochrome c oxidase subunit 2